MDQSKKQEFSKMLANFDTGMLVERGASGELVAQPAAIGTTIGDDRLWLALGVDMEKPLEPAMTDSCLLVCERPGRHLSITGNLVIERERTRTLQAWQPHWQAWFPKGPQAANLLLAHFTPQHAEYWDHSGLMRLTYVFEAARSIVRGGRRPPRREEHIRL